MLIFTAVFQQFFCIDILSNTCRYFFRFLHCQNYGCRAVYYITAAENPGSGSHTVRAFTGNNKTTVVDLDTFGSRNDTGGRSLSDSQDNTITGNDFLTAFGYELTVISFGVFCTKSPARSVSSDSAGLRRILFKARICFLFR